MGTFVHELFRTGLYKRSQGRIARQVTMGALCAILAIGAWRLNAWLIEQISNPSREYLAYVVPFAITAAGFWAGFRFVNVPAFADFLISVEAEMNKVSWPGRTELIRASIVVIVVMFFLATILYFYDILWNKLLHLLRILG